MPLTRKLTIAKSNDGGPTIYVYEGAATGPTASKPSEILGLAYTLYRDRDRLYISRGLDMHGSKATMIANVNGFEGVTAKINAGAQTFASTRRVSSMPWKFTDESQQKFKWHVTSQGRYWDLRTKGGSNAATFTNNGPFEETLGVLEFTRGASESFTQLTLLTMGGTSRVVDTTMAITAAIVVEAIAVVAAIAAAVVVVAVTAAAAAAAGLIFDLDGTLISTLEVTEKIYTKYAVKYNIDPAPILAHCHGVPTQEMHTVEKALELEKEAAEILDGLLASLPAERWSIFTSGLPLLAHPRMRRLQLPIPSGYIRAAKDLGFNAKDCIVFEDAHAGTKAGHDSGATVIGIRTLLSEAQLKEAGADYTVRDMSRVSVCVDQTTGDLTITLNEE
ncbi:hypothetical protein DL89DRAFT_295646 [Linderina pennispora]|uniref:HAD-like protein n=1 Tax=Linderina pennispora TaxID=61395 RepID=A0A1Y1VYQ9_9FUNG|nr:uncharacterized protein DL89DRAFT_295646 [Linderina pennispora]ORX66146.1 hypothetical protein DL89DRAFT_295646 [Linderina pennispora]